MWLQETSFADYVRPSAKFTTIRVVQPDLIIQLKLESAKVRI
jgi:hypothetical protein